jgi:glutathione S-transferase
MSETLVLETQTQTTMAADSTNNIVLYDVAFASPHEDNTCAPNPWKARYALNFKGLAYSTRWVQMHEISTVRRGLGIPACRQFADGTDFYTLPMVTDAAAGAKLGDSFDIACWLEQTYPGSGAGDLFPPQPLDYRCPMDTPSAVPLSAPSGERADYARFNAEVDMAFTLHVQLTAQGMRWDPEHEAAIQAEFLRRMPGPKMSWDDIVVIEPAARAKLIASLRDTLKDLAAMLQRDAAGPFILGGRPSYADIIIGGWLRDYSKTLPGAEWDELRSWYDGAFGRLHDELQRRFGSVK